MTRRHFCPLKLNNNERDEITEWARMNERLIMYGKLLKVMPLRSPYVVARE